jgi:hypothetical protein
MPLTTPHRLPSPVFSSLQRMRYTSINEHQHNADFNSIQLPPIIRCILSGLDQRPWMSTRTRQIMSMHHSGFTEKNLQKA